jgi:hypothetical protein
MNPRYIHTVFRGACGLAEPAPGDLYAGRKRLPRGAAKKAGQITFDHGNPKYESKGVPVSYE